MPLQIRLNAHDFEKLVRGEIVGVGHDPLRLEIGLEKMGEDAVNIVQMREAIDKAEHPMHNPPPDFDEEHIIRYMAAHPGVSREDAIDIAEGAR